MIMTMKSLFAWVYISFCVAWKNRRNTPIQNALVYISFFGARLFLFIYLFSVCVCTTLFYVEMRLNPVFTKRTLSTYAFGDWVGSQIYVFLTR